jgi:hypothetical protein
MILRQKSSMVSVPGNVEALAVVFKGGLLLLLMRPPPPPLPPTPTSAAEAADVLRKNELLLDPATDDNPPLLLMLPVDAFWRRLAISLLVGIPVIAGSSLMDVDIPL